MKYFYFFIFFITSCCTQDFFLHGQKDRLYDYVAQAATNWQLGIKISPFDGKDTNNLIMISKNLLCEEPELVESKDFCKQELDKIRNNYNSIMAFCITETNKYGVIKKNMVVINDYFFYSPYWPEEVKKSVISHEIGHCLGLKHVHINRNIMFPFQEGDRLDFDPQISILKKYYNDKIQPSEKEKIEFFQDYNGYFLRHEKIPSFHVKR